MLFCSRNARPQKALVERAQLVEHNRRPRYFCHSAAWEGKVRGAWLGPHLLTEPPR
jgi:hypothetical protein